MSVWREYTDDRGRAFHYEEARPTELYELPQGDQHAAIMAKIREHVRIITGLEGKAAWPYLCADARKWGFASPNEMIPAALHQMERSLWALAYPEEAEAIRAREAAELEQWLADEEAKERAEREAIDAERARVNAERRAANRARRGVTA